MFWDFPVTYYEKNNKTKTLLLTGERDTVLILGWGWIVCPSVFKVDVQHMAYYYVRGNVPLLDFSFSFAEIAWRSEITISFGFQHNSSSIQTFIPYDPTANGVS